MARVYVSSTFLDLKEERRMVADAAAQLGHHVIAMEDYVASDERPLDRCRADVRECDVYVLIVGWRYGFRPPSGGGRSITELEYEQAVEAGKPRLVFMSSERDEWSGPRDADVASVERFRTRVREDRLPSSFRDPQHLYGQAAVALALEIGTAVPVPRVLPYLCDRSDQYLVLAEALKEATTPTGRRSVVCVAHGEEDQALDGFLEALKEEDLPRRFGHAPEEVHFRWPPGPLERFPARLACSLGDAVCADPAASPEQVAAELAQRDDVLLLTTSLASNEVDTHLPERLRTLAEAAAAWPERPPRKPIIVLVSVVHAAPGPWWRSLWRGRPAHARDMLLAMETKPGLTLLPELHDVVKQNAVDWQALPRVRAWSRDADLTGDIDEVFRPEPELAMRSAARELQRLLQRPTSHRG